MFNKIFYFLIFSLTVIVAILVIAIYGTNKNIDANQGLNRPQSSIIPPEGAVRIIFVNTAPNCDIYINESKYREATDSNGSADITIYEKPEQFKIELKLKGIVQEVSTIKKIDSDDRIITCSGQNNMTCQNDK